MNVIPQVVSANQAMLAIAGCFAVAFVLPLAVVAIHARWCARQMGDRI